MHSVETLLRALETRGLAHDLRVSAKSRQYLNITRDTGEFLAVMVKSSSARRILEIGTSNGYSTIWLAAALEDGGSLTSIERDPAKLKEAKSNFSKAGLSDRIRLLEGDAAALVRDLTAPFDLVFLDADRTIYRDIADHIIRLTRPGGTIICDNAISHSDALKPLVAYFNSLSWCTSCLVPVGKGEFVVHRGVETIA